MKATAILKSPNGKTLRKVTYEKKDGKVVGDLNVEQYDEKESDERMNIIGRNGPSGCHYENKDDE